MTLFELLEKILAAEGDTAEIEVPDQDFNLLMLEILQQKAKKENKKLILKPTGSRSKSLIEQISKGKDAPPDEKEEAPAKKRRFSLPNIRRVAMIPVLIFGILLVLGGIGYWGVYFLPRAEINLTLNPIPLVKEIGIAAQTDAEEVDAEKGIIPGSLRTVEESGEKTADATGSATVGEKATGTVTFTSTDDQSCPQGTRIKDDSSDLIFLTDTAFDLDYPSDNNKDVNVTAENIGSNYNLSSGKTFSIVSGCNPGGAAIAGTNPASFSGGSSQQVKIVSAADQSKVLEELKKEMEETGKQSLAELGGIDEVVVSEAIKVEDLEKTYSHKVGAQAEKFTLTLKMKFTVITYKGSDIQDFISQTIGVLVPEGYALFPGETEIEPLDPRLSDKSLSFQAKITAQVVPEVDIEKIKDELTGRNVESAQQYLSSLGEITSYELKLWPNLPPALQRVPRSTKRITINLVTE